MKWLNILLIFVSILLVILNVSIGCSKSSPPPEKLSSTASAEEPVEYPDESQAGEIEDIGEYLENSASPEDENSISSSLEMNAVEQSQAFEDYSMDRQAAPGVMQSIPEPELRSSPFPDIARDVIDDDNRQQREQLERTENATHNEDREPHNWYDAFCANYDVSLIAEKTMIVEEEYVVKCEIAPEGKGSQEEPSQGQVYGTTQIPASWSNIKAELMAPGFKFHDEGQKIQCVNVRDVAQTLCWTISPQYEGRKKLTVQITQYSNNEAMFPNSNVTDSLSVLVETKPEPAVWQEIVTMLRKHFLTFAGVAIAVFFGTLGFVCRKLLFRCAIWLLHKCGIKKVSESDIANSIDQNDNDE